MSPLLSIIYTWYRQFAAGKQSGGLSLRNFHDQFYYTLYKDVTEQLKFIEEAIQLRVQRAAGRAGNTNLLNVEFPGFQPYSVWSLLWFVAFAKRQPDTLMLSGTVSFQQLISLFAAQTNQSIRSERRLDDTKLLMPVHELSDEVLEKVTASTVSVSEIQQVLDDLKLTSLTLTHAMHDFHELLQHKGMSPGALDDIKYDLIKAPWNVIHQKEIVTIDMSLLRGTVFDFKDEVLNVLKAYKAPAGCDSMWLFGDSHPIELVWYASNNEVKKVRLPGAFKPHVEYFSSRRRSEYRHFDTDNKALISLLGQLDTAGHGFRTAAALQLWSRVMSVGLLFRLRQLPLEKLNGVMSEIQAQISTIKDEKGEPMIERSVWRNLKGLKKLFAGLYYRANNKDYHSKAVYKQYYQAMNAVEEVISKAETPKSDDVVQPSPST